MPGGGGLPGGFPGADVDAEELVSGADVDAEELASGSARSSAGPALGLISPAARDWFTAGETSGNGWLTAVLDVWQPMTPPTGSTKLLARAC